MIRLLAGHLPQVQSSNGGDTGILGAHSLAHPAGNQNVQTPRVPGSIRVHLRPLAVVAASRGHKLSAFLEGFVDVTAEVFDANQIGHAAFM